MGFSAWIHVAQCPDMVAGEKRRCRVQEAPFYALQGRHRNQSSESLCSYYLPLQSQREGWVPGPR